MWELLREDVPLFNKWECIVGQGGFIKTRRLDTLQYQTLVAQSYQAHVFHHKASNKHTIVVSSFPWHNCGTIYRDININEGRFFFCEFCLLHSFSGIYIEYDKRWMLQTICKCWKKMVTKHPSQLVQKTVSWQIYNEQATHPTDYRMSTECLQNVYRMSTEVCCPVLRSDLNISREWCSHLSIN